jgi:NAD(P)-dependent dehydrogenase (short-subunit alcohol dehydrogenase family)
MAIEPTRTPGRFAHRTAIVTGAGGDIGATVAVRLAEEGARVVLADVGGSLDTTAQACAAARPDIEPIVTRFDVTSDDELRRAFDELGGSGVVADVLFNNAGIQGAFDNIVDQDVADVRRVLDVNVVGAFLVLREFARALWPTGRPGAVVNTASMAQTGAPNMAAYSASKAAVVALTKTAAKDLAPASIRVNSVSPAFIGPGAMWDRQVALQAETPSQYFSDDPEHVAAQMIGAVPLRRYGSLDEVASTVLFLLSDESSYITGFDLHVSGGAV